MYKVKIRDASFLVYGQKSIGFLGDRFGEGPKNFEWDNSDPKKDDVCFFTDTFMFRAHLYDCRKKVALTLESPPLRHNGYEYLEKHADEFDAIVTFCTRYPWIQRPHLYSMIRPEDMRLYPKTKFCSMIMSDKIATPNHSFRRQVADVAKGYGVAMFGSGAVARKLDCLSDYAYTIVVEASSEDGCVSEQLWDSLATGTIPIYFGPHFGKFEENLKSVRVERFWNLEELDSILQDLARSPLPNLGIYALELAKAQPSVEDWLWEHERHLFT